MKKNTKINLSELLGNPVTPSQKFQESTKIGKIGKDSSDPSKWPKEWSTVFFKEYPRLDKIILPEPSGLRGKTLEESLKSRSSQRKYQNSPVNLEDLSTLLYFSAGIRNPDSPPQGNRTYPSAGARYPIEIYLISQNSELPNGLYHYNLRSHSLETLDQFKKFDAKKYFNQDYVIKAPVIILFSAVFHRNQMKYGERGYRHVLTEVGHIGQNFWLASEALDLAICGVGGYVDDKLNQLLDIDGVLETVVYVVTLGNKLQNPT